MKLINYSNERKRKIFGGKTIPLKKKADLKRAFKKRIIMQHRNAGLTSK